MSCSSTWSNATWGDHRPSAVLTAERRALVSGACGAAGIRAAGGAAARKLPGAGGPRATRHLAAARRLAPRRVRSRHDRPMCVCLQCRSAGALSGIRRHEPEACHHLLRPVQTWRIQVRQYVALHCVMTAVAVCSACHCRPLAFASCTGSPTMQGTCREACRTGCDRICRLVQQSGRIMSFGGSHAQQTRQNHGHCHAGSWQSRLSGCNPRMPPASGATSLICCMPQLQRMMWKPAPRYACCTASNGVMAVWNMSGTCLKNGRRPQCAESVNIVGCRGMSWHSTSTLHGLMTTGCSPQEEAHRSLAAEQARAAQLEQRLAEAATTNGYHGNEKVCPVPD